MESSRDDFIIAIRSAFLKKGAQQRFSLLSLILFSIIFLVLGNFNFKIIEFNKTIIKEVIYFSSFISTVPENIIKNSFNEITDHFEFHDNYKLTKIELQEFKKEDLSKKILTYENIELKKLIDDYFVEDGQVYGKVLIDKESPFLRSIVVNKGSKNNVKVGMVAYDDIYLVGKVVEVNFLTSRILLISDINSKIPVTIQPLNIQAIMSGLSKQIGKLQYIKDEKSISNENKELLVVTSGSGGVFKSGIPIGKIDSKNISSTGEILVDFYTAFSQLKYVKVSSYKKERTQLGQVNETTLLKNDNQILEIENRESDIQVLQRQKIISEEIRGKLEEENTKLKKNLITIKKLLREEKAKENALNAKDIQFLEMNLLYGHKCRKTFLKSNLYKVSSPEYKICVLNKGLKKN